MTELLAGAASAVPADLPEYMTPAEMKRYVEVREKVVMVLVGGRTYRKEGGQWRCLDYGTTKAES